MHSLLAIATTDPPLNFFFRPSCVLAKRSVRAFQLVTGHDSQTLGEENCMEVDEVEMLHLGGMEKRAEKQLG